MPIKSATPTPECFIGITSWNSAAFLAAALDQVRKTAPKGARVVVLDNSSTDGSAEAARQRGAEVVVRNCNQATALNALLAMSRSRYTLLMHSDVILLNPNWFELCVAKMQPDIALVSPEDIGCGPYTRPWGKGMPESSFLFFDTEKARRARRIFWRQRFKIRWPYRAFDFSGAHITYNIPEALADRGYRWTPMQVYPSQREAEPVYTPRYQPKFWGDHFSHLKYGLGNFYYLDGQLTHYHNWYDRVGLGVAEFDPESTESVPPEGGIPKAWLQVCSRRFLDDLAAGQVAVPSIDVSVVDAASGIAAT